VPELNQQTVCAKKVRIEMKQSTREMSKDCRTITIKYPRRIEKERRRKRWRERENINRTKWKWRD
jgi:hypothetical protein